MPGVRHGDRTLGCALLALAIPLLAGCGGSGDTGTKDPGDAASSSTVADIATLITPDTAGEWTRVTSDAAEENAKAYLIRAEEEAEPGTTPLFAEYERADGATMAFLGFNVDPGSAAAEQLLARPEVVVDVALADAGITDRQALESGEVGGALACGTLPPEYGVDGLTCAWANPTTWAQVTIVIPGLDYEVAGGVTRDFRDAVTDR
jgi:hypothetical protein